MISGRTTNIGLVLAAATALALGPAAKAEVFVIGSTFTVNGTTSGGSYSDTVTLQNGSTTVDGGALALTISIVPDGVNEWVEFSFMTTTEIPSPVMSNTADDWESDQNGLDMAVAGSFIGYYQAFLDGSGNTITPSSGIYGGASVMSNPIPGGSGMGVGLQGFDGPFGPGPLYDLYSDIDPFNLLDSDGVPSANVDGFVQAWEFTAAPVPEPSSMVLLSTVLLGIAFVARKRFAPSR